MRDHALVDALIGFVGVIVGGLLILLGDMARRRAAQRRGDLERLSEAAVQYALVFGRLFGRARDARERGEPPKDERPDRYEASLRFFMTPGAEELYPAAMGIARAYLDYLRLDSTAENLVAGRERYKVAQRAFEARVRDILRRGRIGDAVAMERIAVIDA